MMSGQGYQERVVEYVVALLMNTNSDLHSQPVQIQNQPSAQNVTPNPNTTIRPVQGSNEIYEQHLMLKDRGFPLYSATKLTATNPLAS